MAHNRTLHFITLLAVFCLSAVNIFADALVVNNVTYTTLDNNTAILTNGSNVKGSFVVPGSVSDGVTTYTVTAIGANAFKNNCDITAITIPNTVDSIYYQAFYGCSALEDLTISDGGSRLGVYGYHYNYSGAFYYCGIKNLYLGREIAFTASSRSLFYGTNLMSVNIGSRVKNVAPYLLFDRESITSITIAEGVETFGDYSLCTYGQIASLNLPSTLKYVGKSGLSVSSSTEVNLSDIGKWSQIEFYDASSNPFYKGSKVLVNGKIVKDITIPSSITKIGSYAFAGNKDLLSITIPSSVKTIGTGALSECTQLRTIIGGEGIITIQDKAFNKCSNLSSIYIAASVDTIKNDAFDGCTDIERVNIGSINDWQEIIFGSSTANPLYYAKHLYQNGIEVTSATMPSGLEKISAYTFYNCESLQSYTFNSSVKEIGNKAFYYCKNLSYLSTLPYTVTNIGTGAFSGCDNLTAINVSNGNSKFCSSDGVVFNSAMTSIIAFPGGKQGAYRVPNTVTSLSNYEFQSCNGLTAIYIPSTVSSIYGDAFMDCNNLMNIYVDEGNANYKDIDGVLCYYSTNNYILTLPCGRTSYTVPASMYGTRSGAFSHAKNLKKLSFEPSSTIFYCGTYTNKGEFYNCPLEEVYINRPLGYSENGEYGRITYYPPFCSCKTLEKAVIGDNITSIPTKLFQNCVALKSVTIPESITAIYDYAFSGCLSLPSITIPQSVTDITNYAFEGCKSLSSVKLQANLSHLGGYVFKGTQFLDNLYSNQGIKYVNDTIAVAYDGTTVNVWMYDNKAKILADELFSGAKELKTVHIGAGVRKLYDSMFSGCSALEKVDIPSTVKSIGNYVFQNCGLKKIVIPGSVEEIGSYNFWNTTLLDSLVFEDSSKPLYFPMDKNYSYYYGPLSKSNVKYIYVGRNLSSSYGLFWYTYSSHMSINDGYNTELKTVVFSDSVTAIKDYLFKDCRALSEIRFGKNISSIGGYAFFAALNANNNNGFADSLKIVSDIEAVGSFATNAFSSRSYDMARIIIPYESCSVYLNDGMWAKFKNMEWRKDHLIINESAFPMAYDVKLPGFCNKLTYSRTFNNTCWQPLFVPFYISTEVLDKDIQVASFNNFYQYDTDNDGKADRTILEAKQVKEGTLAANTPYLIRSLNTGNVNIDLQDVHHIAALPDSINCGSMSTSFIFRGTYETLSPEWLLSNKAYVMSAGTLAHSSTSLKPFRWYLKMEGIDSTMDAKQWLGIVVKDGNENVETAILSIDNQNNEMNKYEGMYDLTGRRVHTLQQKGVFISGNKIIIVK